MIWMNGSDYDNYLWQISSGTTTKQYYGYGLKYIGAGNGVDNYLRLIADNQNNTDITAIGINQNGQVGIGADANASYRLYVNGNSYFNGNTTHNGIDYFANGTTYYINNNADFILNNGKVSKLGINANYSDTYVLNVNGSSYFSGNNYNQNIIPIVDNTYTLGESTSSSNKRWKAVYVGTANSYGANSDTLATPIYWNNGIPAPLSVTRGGEAQPVYLKNGSITACSANKGNTTKPVYMNAGTITECSYTLSSTVNSGTANQLAWYNSSTSITTGTKLVTNGTNLGIGTTAINDVGSNALYVNGASKFNGNVTATKFIGPLQGNADTATKLATARTISLTGDVKGSGTFDGSNNLNITTTVADNSHSHSAYLQRGDNIPAGSSVNNTTTSRSYWVTNTAIDQPISGDMYGGLVDQLFFAYTGNNKLVQSYVRARVNSVWQPWSKIWQEGNAVTGAVWNDYAECREADTIEPGYVLVETGDDSLTKSTKRLSPFAGVSSDTWGFSQGETDKAKTPIAVAGRVLVYPWQDRNNYKPGDCVCAAPDGKVDIMTREEIIQYPDRIVGTVSNVPTYDKWGGGEKADRDPVDVNGRIWIKVR